MSAGIPMEEDEDEQDTSIKGRLLMLVNKIKGQSHKAEEPTEKEQAAPCESPRFYSFPQWCYNINTAKTVWNVLTFKAPIEVFEWSFEYLPVL